MGRTSSPIKVCIHGTQEILEGNLGDPTSLKVWMVEEKQNLGRAWGEAAGSLPRSLESHRTLAKLLRAADPLPRKVHTSHTARQICLQFQKDGGPQEGNLWSQGLKLML